jgi:hypothetical protein
MIGYNLIIRRLIFHNPFPTYENHSSACSGTPTSKRQKPSLEKYNSTAQMLNHLVISKRQRIRHMSQTQLTIGLQCLQAHTERTVF